MDTLLTLPATSAILPLPNAQTALMHRHAFLVILIILLMPPLPVPVVYQRWLIARIARVLLHVKIV